MTTAAVDRVGCCDQCPMLFQRGGDKATCLHPGVVPFDGYHGGRRFRVVLDAVPDWCPLRVMPVLVVFDPAWAERDPEDDSHTVEPINVELPAVR